MATSLAISTCGNEDVALTVCGDHTLIISTKDAVMLKCVRCGGVKDLYMHTDQRSYDWIRTCNCTANAPRLGGDAGITLTSDLLPFDMVGE